MKKFVVFKDQKKEWRWRLMASNGRIVCESGEGYKRIASALNIIHQIQDGGFCDVKIRYID